MPSFSPEIQDLPAGQWTKISANTSSGFVHILKPDAVYYKTYRLPGNPPPDNLPAPGDPDFEGAAIYNRPDRIAGVDVFVGGASLETPAGGDVYIYPTKTGKLRVDKGAADEEIAVENPLFWYNGADAGKVILNGSRAERFLDGSGNNFHLDGINPARQPLYLPGAVNGRNCLRFTRSRGDHLSHSLFASPVNQPHTIFVVAREFTGSGFRTLMRGKSFSWSIGSSGNRIKIDTGGVPRPTGAIAFGGNVRLHTMVFNGASSQLFLDRDVNPLTGNFLTGGIFTGLEIGSRLTTGSSHAWNGDICEIRGYPGLLTTPEHEATRNQMIPKWGIPA